MYQNYKNRWFRDTDYGKIKKNRGKADLNEKRDWTDFVKHDRNEVLDEEILYFIPELKKKMQEDYNI